MKYRIINKNIINQLSANETYTLFCLISKSDFETGLSHIKQDNLKDLVGIKKLDTIQAHLKKFYKWNILTKNTIVHDGEKGYFKTNTYQYHIPKENWVRIKVDLIENLNIPSKIKGFLILLKCLCVNNTNLLNYNKSQISKLLNIDVKTVRNYIKVALESKLIEETNSGFRIINNSILEDYKEPIISKSYKVKSFTEYYNVIQKYCVDNNLPIPRFDEFLIEKISLNFDSIFLIEKMNENIQKLKKRKYLTIKYIAKIMGIDTTPQKNKSKVQSNYIL